jgi:hypothetical protein
MAKKPLKLKHLWEYDAKILMALAEAIDGNKKIFAWLLNNNYPELAAFAAAVRADEGALKWLMKNGFPHLAILSDAIDDEDKAKAWFKKHKMPFYLIFADACSVGGEAAMNWLQDHKYKVFLVLAIKTREVLKQQAFDHYDYHKMWSK